MGDELALIALTIRVANLTNSGWGVAALLLAGLLPLVVFAPAAGVIVDNFETTRTLAVSTAAQALLAVALAFATGFSTILLLAFLLGVGTAVATPSLYTLIPAVVGEERATQANAYFETARYGGMVAGPVLAGALSATLGSKVALLVDAVTFVAIALAALALVTRRQPQTEEADRSERGEARAGLEVIRRDRLLVMTFSVFAVVILFAAMDNVAEVFFARNTLHAGSWGYGLLASIWLVGIVIGTLVIARTLPKDRLVPALLVASVIGGGAVGLAAFLPSLALALSMFLVGGVANGVQGVSVRSLVVHRVQDRYRGRVFAAYGGLATGMQIGAMALGGALVFALGGRATLVVGGLGCVIAGVVGLLWFGALPASVRAMPQVIPEAPPPDVVLHLPEPAPADPRSSSV